jgi:hypothetical protein
MKKTSAWILIQCASAINILAGIVIAHQLAPAEFGKFATMSAALMMITSVLNPLSNELAHLVSSKHALNYIALRNRTGIALLLCGAVAACSCASIIESSVDGILLAVLLPLSMVVTAWTTGILAGLHRMAAVGVMQTLGALAKFIVIALCITSMPSFVMISWAYEVGFIIACAVSIYLIGRIPTVRLLEWNTHWGIIGGFFFLALPFSLDQTLIQSRFPEASGEYAAVMTYAKSLMLLAGPALTIAYSSALRERHHTPIPRLCVKAFIVFTATTAPLGWILWKVLPALFPLLLGSQYTHVMSNTSYALIAIGCHVVAYAVIQLAVLLSRWWISPLLVLPAALQATLLWTLQNPSIEDLVLVSLWTFVAQLLIAVVACFALTVRSRVAHA